MSGASGVTRTRVLVVGAGPVGTTAAFRLAQLGIDTVLIEAQPGCPEDMRASTFHPPTLDMMEELGVLDELERQGLRAQIYQYRNRRSGALFELDLGEVADVLRHPYRLQCEQYKLARLLSSRLEALCPGAVRFQRRLLDFVEDDSGVTVNVEAPFSIETYRADYVIAADGANSVVRKWLGIEFEGFTYPERFLTLSTDFPIEDRLDRLAHVNYVADAQEWCVLLRVPALWRVLVPAAADVSDAELLSDDYKNRVFDGLTGDGRAVFTYHRTVYRVHQRVATRYRAGRLLLAGDAAHMNNPLGGFGMNSGIHDVWNLTAKLREIIEDRADADVLLDRYDRQRRTIASQFVQAQTIQNKQLLETGSAADPSAQEQLLEALSADPDRRRNHLLRQAMHESLQIEAGIT